VNKRIQLPNLDTPATKKRNFKRTFIVNSFVLLDKIQIIGGCFRLDVVDYFVSVGSEIWQENVERTTNFMDKFSSGHDFAE
jgi:hypothetical protein